MDGGGVVQSVSLPRTCFSYWNGAKGTHAFREGYGVEQTKLCKDFSGKAMHGRTGGGELNCKNNLKAVQQNDPQWNIHS